MKTSNIATKRKVGLAALLAVLVAVFLIAGISWVSAQGTGEYELPILACADKDGDMRIPRKEGDFCDDPEITGAETGKEILIPLVDYRRFQLLVEEFAGLEARVDTLEARNLDLQGQIDSLQADLAQEATARAAADSALDGDIGALQSLLTHVSRDGNDLTISGANLHVVNGTGSTDGATNGLGNIIIGYNEPRAVGRNERTGSHMLVVGKQHNYSSYGGIVAGMNNETVGSFASVTAGQNNEASGPFSSVSGGTDNRATAEGAAVSGGYNNSASGLTASVSGGASNQATVLRASVSGGSQNMATSAAASVSGGNNNQANAPWSSISGGQSNIASGPYSAVNGGIYNNASGDWAAVNAGDSNEASGDGAAVNGGQLNIASGDKAVVSAGWGNDAQGFASTVAGGAPHQWPLRWCAGFLVGGTFDFEYNPDICQPAPEVLSAVSVK